MAPWTTGHIIHFPRFRAIHWKVTLCNSCSISLRDVTHIFIMFNKLNNITLAVIKQADFSLVSLVKGSEKNDMDFYDKRDPVIKTFKRVILMQLYKYPRH